MLRLAKNDFEKILNSLEEGIIISDTNRVILFFNSAAEKIMGYTADKVVGRHCYELFRSNHCHSDCNLLEAIRTGKEINAPEVIIKNSNGEEVPIRGRTTPFKTTDNLRGVIQIFSDISEIVSLRKHINQHLQKDFITKSPELLDIIATIQELAVSDMTILILGETGTGKEILARNIHKNSLRKNAPFVRVNCGALPDNLLESELFGHVAGAYTDAKKARKGRLEIAEGGTLFLDEIGDMSPGMQVKVLRVLQEKTYEPLGSSETKYGNVRFISATNRDLSKMLEEGRFRKDLYYRINTMVIRIPPLRDRQEDIPLLINHFLEKYNQLMGEDIQSVHEKAMEVLIDFPWPGNVRQLEHVIERAFVLTKGDEILLNHLPREVLVSFSKYRETHQKKPSLNTKVSLSQKEMILSCLKKHKWNKVLACQELGISRSTLWRKMKALQIPISSIPKQFHN